jgi:hypothetical protein
MNSRRGSSLIIILICMAVFVPATLFLTRNATEQDRLNTRLRAIGSAKELAGAMAVDYMSQFSEDWYTNHFNANYLLAGYQRMNVDSDTGSGWGGIGTGAGNFEASAPVPRKDIFRSLSIQMVGRYFRKHSGTINETRLWTSKNLEVVIGFRSDLSRYGYLFPGDAIIGGGGSGATFEGKTLSAPVYVGRNLTLEGNVTFNGSPVVAQGTLTPAVGTTFAAGSVLYYSTGPLALGTYNGDVHHMTWYDTHFASDTIDLDYYRGAFYYRTTADQKWVFIPGPPSRIDIYDPPGSALPTGSFNISSTTSSLVLLAENADLTITGTVKGHVTVAAVSTDPAKGNILVEGDFVYANGAHQADSSDSAAVLASGIVTIRGLALPILSNRFNGIFYGETGLAGDALLIGVSPLLVNGSLISNDFTGDFITVTQDPEFRKYPAPLLPERPRIASYVPKG